MNSDKPKTKSEWIEAITKICTEAGTYQPTDDAVIEILADIMKKRALAESEFLESGGHTVITHTNRAKQTNVCKNPILTTWMDLTAAALPYWRELGLTPAARKKLTGEMTAGTNSNALAEALKGL